MVLVCVVVLCGGCCVRVACCVCVVAVVGLLVRCIVLACVVLLC